MSRQDVIEVEGVVTGSYPNAMFEVELPNGHKVRPHFGKMRMHYIASIRRQGHDRAVTL